MKSSENIVTNISVMLGSLVELVDTIERHVGKSVEPCKSRFFVKRFIKNLRATKSPAICLDSTSFDVEDHKRTRTCRNPTPTNPNMMDSRANFNRLNLVHGEVRLYKSYITCILVAARLLDPSVRKQFKEVVDFTANTPDKAEFMRSLQKLWDAVQSGSNKQLFKLMDLLMGQFEGVHCRLVDHLGLFNCEIAKSFRNATPKEIQWFSDLKEECIGDDDTECYFY